LAAGDAHPSAAVRQLHEAVTDQHRLRIERDDSAHDAGVRHVRRVRGVRYVAPSAIALIYVGLEDKRTAHAWLEKAYLEHDTFLVLKGADLRLDKLRS
jgi:hypothetical protein